MNSLDELFGEELARATLDASPERRTAVADVTVVGARRKRRVRALAQGVAIVAVAAFGIAVGSLLLGQGSVAPAVPTPSVPTPPAVITAPPDAAGELDPRFAPAPAMDAADWSEVNFTWDAELASFIGGGKDGYGSVLAIYLTPPGGSRMLAYANSESFIQAPTLLGFDAHTRSVIVTGDAESGGVRAINLLTGVASSVDLQLHEPISGLVPLGKISNGDNVFAAVTANSHNEYTVHVFRTFDNTAVPVREGSFDVSPVWEDRLVIIEDGKFTFLDADGAAPDSIDGADGCGFAAWNTDGTFIAICGGTQQRTGTYVRVDPETGSVATVWTDTAYTEDTGGADALTQFRAVDRSRSWDDGMPGNWMAYSPPVVYSDGVKVVDLAQGFSETPKTYGIIFGVGGED